ncbi:hypothetical protein [Ascidiaceihabitans donghaensis]|uniref:hypothetical protein n=1 Tax=Ascidiaceihabitans donghaensis TaxID=1510460 RepID=UPI000D557B70|nr:hypothetical protein [Ascidiaceihabitans donghaensis]
MKLERQPLKNDLARLRSCELAVHVSTFAHGGVALCIAWKFEAVIELFGEMLRPVKLLIMPAKPMAEKHP